MKKSFNILMMMMGVLLLVSACGKSTRTLVEMKKDERKAIQRLMDSLNIKVIKDYPANGKFAENEFWELKSGLYMNVVDSGNGTRATPGSTKIFCHFELDIISGEYRTIIETFDNFKWYPLEFIYGASATATIYYSDYYCQGLIEPLEYVGDNSVVKLIVPFKVGSKYQNDYGNPIYYKRLKYVFEK